MIEARNLGMDYGPVRALQDVSFSVGASEIVGLLGPNGAGKTTIMRILTTFVWPSRGTALVNGVDVTADPLGARRHLGYLPETPPLYSDMRVDEFVDFVGRARGLSGPRLRERKNWVADACGLAPVWKHQVHELSLGFRQRVGLAQALVHDPKVLILDEPTSGLDPLQIIGIRALVRELAKSKSVIFSTHVLQEAAALSNRLLIINQGRIVAQGGAAELQAAAPRREELFRVTLSASRAEAEQALSALPALKRAVYAGDSRGGRRFDCAASSYADAVRAVNEMAVSRKWEIRELSPEEPSLEDVFVGFYKKSPKGDGA